MLIIPAVIGMMAVFAILACVGLLAVYMYNIGRWKLSEHVVDKAMSDITMLETVRDDYGKLLRSKTEVDDEVLSAEAHYYQVRAQVMSDVNKNITYVKTLRANYELTNKELGLKEASDA